MFKPAKKRAAPAARGQKVAKLVRFWLVIGLFSPKPYKSCEICPPNHNCAVKFARFFNKSSRGSSGFPFRRPSARKKTVLPLPLLLLLLLAVPQTVPGMHDALSPLQYMVTPADMPRYAFVQMDALVATVELSQYGRDWTFPADTGILMSFVLGGQQVQDVLLSALFNYAFAESEVVVNITAISNIVNSTSFRGASGTSAFESGNYTYVVYHPGIGVEDGGWK